MNVLDKVAYPLDRLLETPFHPCNYIAIGAVAPLTALLLPPAAVWEGSFRATSLKASVFSVIILAALVSKVAIVFFFQRILPYSPLLLLSWPFDLFIASIAGQGGEKGHFNSVVRLSRMLPNTFIATLFSRNLLEKGDFNLAVRTFLSHRDEISHITEYHELIKELPEEENLITPDAILALGKQSSLSANWRYLATKFHPDKNPETIAFAKILFNLVKAAYDEATERQGRKPCLAGLHSV